MEVQQTQTKQSSIAQQFANSLSTVRSLRDIVGSFLMELHITKKVDDKLIIETLPILLSEIKRHPRAYMVHVKGKQWYWFHDLWWDDYCTYRINCEIATRSIGKSTFWTEFINDYNCFLKQNYEALIVGFNAESGRDFLAKVKREYQDNDFMKTRAKLERDDKWSATQIEFEGGNNLRGFGINQHLRRHHVNNLSLDDIKNDKQTMTDFELKGSIMGTFLPMIQRKRGRMSIVGTLFSENDIYHFFKSQSKIESDWNYRRTYVELDDVNKLVYICSEGKDGIIYRKLDTDFIFEYNFLNSLKIADPDYYAREYECIIMSGESAIFPFKDYLEFSLYDKEDFETEASLGATYLISGDIARSDKGDYSVFYVLRLCGLESSKYERIKTDFLKVSYIERVHGMITSGQEDIIQGLSKKFNNAEVIIEKNNLGQSIIDNLNERGVRVTEFQTDRFSKPDMIDNLKNFFNPLSPKIVIPYGVQSKPLVDELLYELTHFKRVIDKYGTAHLRGVGAHDDMVMALAIGCKHGTRRGGGKFVMYGRKYNNRLRGGLERNSDILGPVHNLYKNKKVYKHEVPSYD